MASIVKRGRSYRIKFIHPITRKHGSLTIGFQENFAATLRLAKARKADIEQRIAMHKAGLKRFSLDDQCENVAEMTLGEFTNLIRHDELRQGEVDEKTFKANLDALNNLVEILGSHIRLQDLAEDSRYINQFKQARFNFRVERCKQQGKRIDEDQIKRGIYINKSQRPQCHI